MSLAPRLKLRPSEGRAQLEFPVASSTALTQQIAQHNVLSPGDELWLGGRWVRLDAHPDKPWLEPLQQQLDHCLRIGDAISARRLAEKIVAFGGSDDAVLIANFALGYLDASAGQFVEAAALLQQVIVRPSCCSAAAFNNLGVISARLRRIPAAVEYLQRAAMEDPQLITAQLSLLNLAKSMLDESASDLPGSLSWKDLEARASQVLATTSSEAVEQLAGTNGGFPSYHLLLVLNHTRHFPPLSANLPQSDTAGPAARHLLEAARQQFQHGHFASAAEQAEQAAQLSPQVHPEAHRLAAHARLKDQECRRLAEQQRHTSLLEQFQRSLDEMTLETMDQPRPVLELLRPYNPNTQPLDLRYRERVAELIDQRLLQTSGGGERERLMSLSARFLNDQQAAAMDAAARQVMAAPALEAYRRAVCTGEIEMAELAADQVTLVLGHEPDDVREILKDQRREHVQRSKRLRPSGFEMIAVVWRLIKGGCFQDAVNTMREFLITQNPSTEVVALNSHLEAAQRHSTAREQLRANDWSHATTALLQTLEREPRHRTALMQLLTIEILRGGLSGDIADRAVQIGTAAICAVLADNRADGKELIDNLANMLPSSRLVQHLRTVKAVTEP